jgi:dienelactone hydrolase
VAFAVENVFRCSVVVGAECDAGKWAFPVLIYAPSDSSVSWENADLCEYFSSHGYVVLASPSMGASTRDMTDDLDGINAQARDILPDKLVKQLKDDEAIAEADTVLLTVPNQLGVAYNAHVMEAILTTVAPAMGWR